MADESQVAMLKRSVEEWNEWRQQNPKVRPDLTGADLSNLDLSFVNFTHTNLRGANFSNSSLRGAFLVGALIKTANFTGIDLGLIDLRNEPTTSARAPHPLKVFRWTD